MKLITTLAAAAGIAALAACNESPREERAENIEETAENRAENIEEAAENEAEAVEEGATNAN